MTDQYDVPESLMYTRDHEWAQSIGDTVRVGITDYAAKTLNDIVYISLPSVGQAVKQSATFGTVESIKAVSELYSPLSGSVTKVNSGLSNHPELVNQSPYGEGWITEISPSNLADERNKLLSSRQYVEFLGSLEK
jgi:glycine cleavage system H protein